MQKHLVSVICCHVTKHPRPAAQSSERFGGSGLRSRSAMCSFPVQGLCKARLSVLRRLKLGWCWRGGAGWKSVPGKADLSLGLLERAHSMAACDPSARSGQRSLEVTQQHSPCAGSEGLGAPWEPASLSPEDESGLHREAMRGLNHSRRR